MSVQQVLKLARQELGVTEQPAGSNRTRYGAAYGLDGQPWCMMFLWWVFQTAGESAAFYGGGKTASCGALLRYARQQGQVREKHSVQPGDILILNFSGTQDTEHCGLVTAVENGCFRTIEGNTSLQGSQSNGGMVAEKLRYPGQVVGVIRPPYRVESDTDGHWAEPYIRSCRERSLMEGYPDGSFRPEEPLKRCEAAKLVSVLYDRAVADCYQKVMQALQEAGAD